MSFLLPGQCEVVKGAVHGGMLVLASETLLYNVVAYTKRREPHLAVNVGVYGALLAFEAYQVWKHASHNTGSSTVLVPLRAATAA